MAERGGYQHPSGPKPPAGPGKFSQRTDGNQPVRVPGLDNPDMQYGDVGRLRDAQKVAPIPARGAGLPPAASPGAPVRPQGGLPDFITQEPSARPDEPVTHGLSTGAGAGPEVLPIAPPDPKEQVLQYLYSIYQDQNALDMLNRLRSERTAATSSGTGPMPQGGVPQGQMPSGR